MTAAPNFYTKARSETAELLHYDLGCLTPEQSLRLDCATALRLALDDLQGRIVRGESADVSRMLTASEALARLLPPTVLATPPSEPREDPRQVMWELYKQMRERGEIGLKALPPEGDSQHRIDELEAKVAELEAALKATGNQLSVEGRIGLAPTPLDVPTSDIVPPSELAQPRVGIERGPDDPPPRSTRVIEGRANPPAASAAPQYDYNKDRGWRDYVEADGTIRSKSRGRGHSWGPV